MWTKAKLVFIRSKNSPVFGWGDHIAYKEGPYQGEAFWFWAQRFGMSNVSQVRKIYRRKDGSLRLYTRNSVYDLEDIRA